MSAWVPTGEFTIGLKPRPAQRLTTSSTELLHLLIAFGVLSTDLAIIQGFSLGRALHQDPVVAGFLFGAAAALSGFVAHELAHKIAAQRHGFWAEFRMSPFGLVISFMSALLGFLFAAPGATMIGGMGDPAEWGKTSLAGPALNLGEAALFLGGAFGALRLHSDPGWVATVLLLAFFNSWFAAFNLLPVGPLDGRKVYRWDGRVWAASFAAAVAFAVVAYALTRVF